MGKYNIIIKTGEAELRALEHIPSEYVASVFPIIELTRGRKITKNNSATYPFEKRLERIKKIFIGQEVCIDVTSETTLSSPETEALFSPKNGYKNWIDFLIKLKNENVFSRIIPTVLWNFNDPNFEENISLQISSLINEFGLVAYRNSIEENNDFYNDIESFLKEIPLLFILDCEYVPRASVQNVAQRCIARLNNLKSILEKGKVKFILVSTSYPNNVTEFGDLDNDVLALSEIDLYKAVATTHSEVLYGDYGSINPIRNDAIVMARGWVPKIDVSLPDKVFYHRQRRPKGVTAYADTYIHVAKSCISDEMYPKHLSTIWGLQQIELCADGSVPSASPSFWLSVRMNTHIMQRLKSNII